MLRPAIGDAFRVTRNTPWTSFAIVLTLSLGTGLNAVVFALTYGIFFRPLPYRDPAALVRIDQESRSDNCESGRRDFERSIESPHSQARHTCSGASVRLIRSARPLSATSSSRCWAFRPASGGRLAHPPGQPA